MKNKDSQPIDDERLIKTLSQIGRMYDDMKPGLAERIKQQIPENLKSRQQSARSLKAIMNLRIGKLVAAAVIAGEVILFLCVLGGEDLADEVYMQGKYLTKYCEPYAKMNWNKFANHIEKYSCPNRPQRRIRGQQTITQEQMMHEQQKPQPTTGETRDKKTDDIYAEGLIAKTKPSAKDENVEWSDILKAGRPQESVEEAAQRNAEAVVDALKSFAWLTGTYPNQLSIMTVMEEFREAYKARQAGKVIPKDKRYRQLADTTKKLKWLCNFYSELYKKGKDPAYYGHKFESRKADAVLMRWQLATGKYQVIFGDLRTGIVTTEQLELLEQLYRNGNHL